MHHITRDQLLTASREVLIAWLSWNDRNGIYADEECDEELLPRITTEEARELALRQFDGGFDSV